MSAILSERIIDNVKKGRWLEVSFDIALCMMCVDYIELTHIHNFKNKLTEGVADFLTITAIIEMKNWNCINYCIDMGKAKDEICPRFKDYPDKMKVLIVSNPRWDNGTKEYLQIQDVKIYELGYMVDKATFPKAIDDLKNIVADIHSIYLL
jgi:hypothetical protein